MKRHSLATLMTLAALPWSGCGYLADRGLDLAQTVDLSLGLSQGVAANVRATKFLQLGFGSYRGVWWAGLKDGLVDVWQEERSELGVGPFYLHEVFRTRGARLLNIRYPLFGDPGFKEHAFDLTHLSDRGLFDVGVTVNAVLFGCDVALRGAELVDLLLGLVTLDVLGDDVYGPSEQELSERLSGSSARARAAAARALRLRFGQEFGYQIYGAPDQMPAFQIQAIRRWRERLGTLTTAETPAAPAPPDPDPASSP